MPKIRKILRANAEKSALRTDGLTNEHEFIGPFSTSWGTNNKQALMRRPPLWYQLKIEICQKQNHQN